MSKHQQKRIRCPITGCKKSYCDPGTTIKTGKKTVIFYVHMKAVKKISLQVQLSRSRGKRTPK